jgi:parallel beta-helix repeat protein
VITLEGSVTVDWPWRLEIAPGTIVQIPAEEEIIINSLAEINGTSDNPVVFKPIEGARDAGIWRGLELNGGSLVRHAQLQGAERCIEIRDGVSVIADNLISGCVEAGIYVFKGTPTIQNNLVIENAGVGIGLYGSSASPIIQYNTIDLNGGNGLNIDYVDDNRTEITNNIITRNGGGGWTGGSGVTPGYNNLWRNTTNYLGSGAIGPSSLGHISSDPQFLDQTIGDRRLSAASPSFFANANGEEIGAYGNGGTPPAPSRSVSLMPTLEGELTGDERWSGIIELTETVFVNKPWRLEIAPGTIIRVPSNESLRIAGTAEMIGTSDAPIVFELLNEEGLTDQDSWDGIILSGNAELRHLDITEADRCIIVESGVPVISENKISNCAGHGIYVDGGSPQIEHNLIINNQGVGLGVYGSATPLVRYNTIDSNDGVGLDFAGRQNSYETLVQNNAITNNRGAGWFGGAGIEADHNLLWRNMPDYKSYSMIPSTHLISNPSYILCPDNTGSRYCIAGGTEAKTAASDGGEVGRYGDQDFMCSVNNYTLGSGNYSLGSRRLYSETLLVLGGVGGSLNVSQAASLQVKAPTVRLEQGITVNGTGQLVISSEQVACTEGRGRMRPLAENSESRSVADERYYPSHSAKEKDAITSTLFASSQALPSWAKVELSNLGVSLESLSTILLDKNGEWIILESEEPIAVGDMNTYSDIYYIDVVSANVLLVSATEAGVAGNAASRFPAEAKSGEWIFFESDATDLVPGDNNLKKDVFMYDQSLEQMTRVTDADHDSSHPSVDVAGELLLYEQFNAEGLKRIQGQHLQSYGEPAEISLLNSQSRLFYDNHHPTISPDGRYIAYIEESLSDDDTSCKVYILDRDTSEFQRIECPAASSDLVEDIMLKFDPSNKQLLWYEPGTTEAVELHHQLALDIVSM